MKNNGPNPTSFRILSIGYLGPFRHGPFIGTSCPRSPKSVAPALGTRIDSIGGCRYAENSYCKPQQCADRWKMSENSASGKFSEKYLHKNVPGAASALSRKSKFWHNTPIRWLRKIPSFHGASSNGFWYILEKPQGADSAPPPPHQ